MTDPLRKSLEELAREVPGTEHVGISSLQFSANSNNVLQGQNNTIIKLLLNFFFYKLEELE